jgi:hypothetical protein
VRIEKDVKDLVQVVERQLEDELKPDISENTQKSSDISGKMANHHDALQQQ